jgi:hypothetical protein
MAECGHSAEYAEDEVAMVSQHSSSTHNAVWIALTGIAVNYFYDVGKDSTWSRRFGFC